MLFIDFVTKQQITSCRVEDYCILFFIYAINTTVRRNRIHIFINIRIYLFRTSDLYKNTEVLCIKI